jgi:tetratricopeptide (TPR) repeat protein
MTSTFLYIIFLLILLIIPLTLILNGVTLATLLNLGFINLSLALTTLSLLFKPDNNIILAKAYYYKGNYEKSKKYYFKVLNKPVKHINFEPSVIYNLAKMGLELDYCYQVALNYLTDYEYNNLKSIVSKYMCFKEKDRLSNITTGNLNSPIEKSKIYMTIAFYYLSNYQNASIAEEVSYLAIHPVMNADYEKFLNLYIDQAHILLQNNKAPQAIDNLSFLFNRINNVTFIQSILIGKNNLAHFFFTLAKSYDDQGNYLAAKSLYQKAIKQSRASYFARLSSLRIKELSQSQ